MRKILVISAIILSGFDSYGATARSAVSSSSRSPSSGVLSRFVTAPATTTQRVVTNRAATQQPTAEVRGGSNNNARSATVSRAAKQSVISTGTKVAAAAQNTAVDQVCWEKFSGCMDSFCMLDNANGGRCICSDKNAEYDAILAEIQALDEQSYQMATVGVERIEMGDDADAVMKRTQEITKSIEKDAEKAKSKRQSLDLSAWNINAVDFDADVEDMFSITSDGISIEGKEGDALYRVSAKLCNAQVPECASQSKMMELMYQQRVRSDCTAYENSLRQQRTQSAQKLAAAQSAMREAALEQYRNANKYDLGQCTVQFKQCMQTTGGCGEDFTGCVEYSVREGLVNKGNKTKTIKGTSSKITLSAETYDVLESKKELCMNVTQQCVNVRDQVWDTFLREVAPQVKSAELIVESNMRTSCIANISNCFQKACRENMDPNDPDGSYDMCLTRPETLRSACKVEIDPCEGGIPNIMDYVRARLASMRVDSCTREFKECLTSEDRCGKDYTQCIGLDTDTIVRKCPAEKLVGCQYDGGNSKDQNGYQKATVRTDDEIYNELATIAQGIFLNIDNNMLTACQRAADAAMIRVCGSTENCDDIVVDNGAGTRSFKYEVCEYDDFTDQKPNWTGKCYDSLDGISEAQLQHTADGPKTAKGWASKLSGLIYWGEISYDAQNNEFTPIDKYMEQVAQATGSTVEGFKTDGTYEIIRDRVYGTEIRALTSAVENAIKAIESDQTVQYCMTGRRFQGMRMSDGKVDPEGTLAYLGSVKTSGEIDDKLARFPNLTSQMRQIIANSALKNARDNYMVKYDEEIQRMMKDQIRAAERIDSQAATLEAAQSCENWKLSSSLPETKAPKASNTGKWVAISLIAAAAIAASIFTFGGSLFWGGSAIAALASFGSGVTATGIAAVGTIATAVGGTIAASTMAANVTPVDKVQVDQWNYKMTVDTTFNWETGECFKTTITQDCAKVKKNYCEDWADPVETVTSIDLLSND